MVRDMTKGRPLGRILGFCLPLLVGNLFQQFYNMADSIIVGQFLGKSAFAAVGSTGSINFLIIGFVLGLASGFSIPVSQEFGAGDENAMRRCVANSIYLSAAITLLLTLVTVLTTRQILVLLRTPEDILEDAYAYILIIFAGMAATMLYNLPAGILRALGDSKTPLYFLAVACVLNVALDYVFIAIVPLGVAGAAYATVVSQAVSGLLCLIYIKKKFPILRLSKEDMRPNRQICHRLLNAGVPMGLQFSITAVGSIILQAAVNGLGSDVVAAISAASRVQAIVTAPMETMGITMATYCGQNYGAGRIDRVRKGVLQSTIVSMAYCVLAFFASVQFGRQISRLFIQGSETVIFDYIHQFLFVNGAFFPLLMIILIYRNSLQGLGFSRAAMFAGLFELIGRSAVAFWLVGPFGYAAVCYANPAAWVLADALLLPLYIYEIKRMLRWQAGRERLAAGA